MRYHPFSHFGLKVVSLALAILFWMMVSAQRSSVERGLRIPLELQNLPENLEMVDPPQEAVDVRVRGDADALGRLVPGDLVANVDLSAAQSGRRLFHISPDRVKAPFAVEVRQVLPSAVASMANAGPHGFTEVLYAFTSASNNNGSAFGLPWKAIRRPDSSPARPHPSP